MSDNLNHLIVDAILFNLKIGTKTEAEAVATCGDLLKHQVLDDLTYLQHKDHALYQKVMEWCEKHPPEL